MGPGGYRGALADERLRNDCADGSAVGDAVYAERIARDAAVLLRHVRGGAGSIWGFYDAFNPTQDWFSDQFISIDQGPIIVMIENYRTGLCWRLFMQNPEIEGMMEAIGMYYEVDYDLDGDIDIDDFDQFSDCLNGPLAPPGACSAAQQADSDLNNDEAVDIGDAAILQRLYDPT
jgi:hypothetical protein